MFTISAKGAYGLFATMELARLFHQESVQIKEIADSQGIPQHYLEQLLVTLRKAGLVKSYRGTNGGYALARSPKLLTVLEILSALEGPVEVLREQLPTGGLEFFFDRLKNQITGLLTLTLEDLLMEQEKHRENFVYTI